MFVDVHGHLAPFGEKGGGPPSLRDPEGALAAKREHGVVMTIIGSPVGPGSMLPDGSAGNYRYPADQVRAHNEHMGELVDLFPDSLRAYAYLNPLGGDAMLAQAADLVSDGRFVGLIVNSSIDGEFLGVPEAEDFFAMAADLAVPVLLHPPAGPVGVQSMAHLGLVEHVVRVSDVTMGIAAIVCAGWLERFPDLRLIAACGGGGIAHLAEKLDLAMARSPGLSSPPSASLKKIFVETSCPSRAQLAANLCAFGASHILFGTDAPPLMDGVRQIVDTVSDVVGVDELHAIGWQTASDLFGLELEAKI
ncbi:amidohydrolase family protein [Nonomuraea sp. CA-141351]|uniref:amidohydrolase family protein n=1 Tax=Nonomuraea sp. CA-141351 TaxID=3239996 RepID=UPI003D908FBC